MDTNQSHEPWNKGKEYRRYRRPLVPLGLPLLVSISRGRDHQSKWEASMNQNTIYVGIDVDDVRYHGSALNPSTGEMLDFDCRPTLKGLVGQLERVRGGLARCR